MYKFSCINECHKLTNYRANIHNDDIRNKIIRFMNNSNNKNESRNFNASVPNCQRFHFLNANI